MAREARHREPQQQWRALRAHARDGLAGQPFRGLRVGAVAFQDGEPGEGGEVRRDVAARGLQLRGHRDAERVVLDIEQHRQLQGRGDVQRRPESVGGGGGIPAQHHGDAVRVSRVLQPLVVIADRLGPARRGRVLRAHAPAGRQHARAAASGQVEHHPDVAATTEGAGARQRPGGGILQTHAQRQHQRPRAVVHRRGIVGVGELQPEQDLRQIVPARGELVEHLALGQ
jgi:hypothetical protein